MPTTARAGHYLEHIPLQSICQQPAKCLLLQGLRYHLKDLHEFCMGSTSKETWVLLQGLSHYLEHMLFMGSAKFPDENSYDAFLSAHAGSSNAYTELVRCSKAREAVVCLIAWTC